MRLRSNTEATILFAGDIIFWLAALWVSLFIRQGALPTASLFYEHAVPFTLLFPFWILVFFLFDLYVKHTVAFKRRLFGRIVKAQFVNTLIAIVFFYFIPFFGITPKIVLFYYVIISFIAIVLWRFNFVHMIHTGSPLNALVVGEGPEIEELRNEIAHNTKYGLRLVQPIQLKDIRKQDVDIIILDLANKKTRARSEELYHLALGGIAFVDVREFFERIFDRIPLSLIDAQWVIRNISSHSRALYDIAKRVMDLCIAIPLGMVTLIVYPFVYIAIRFEDDGPLFIYQERVGKNGALMKICKFRSMTGDDKGAYAMGGKTQLHETRVGRFLRKTRIDEFPQLLNVIRGDLSLVGPRPELPALAEIYRKEIPYYDMRHTIQPGLSGWAQIYHEQHPHHGTAVQDTRDKLSYDLFYVKNRSFLLDLKIALRTISVLLSMVGR